TLTAASSGIQDVAGNALAADASDAWSVDTTAPTVDLVNSTTSLPDDTKIARATSSDEQIMGVDLADLSLSRDGGANLLTGSQTLARADNVTWTLGNLTGITGTEGSYALTLTAASSGIQDAVGNALAADASDAWSADTTAPTVALVNSTTSLPEDT